MNRLKLTMVMLIWGSLGIFTKYIPLSALSLSFLRASIALPVLFLVMHKKKTKTAPLKHYMPYLLSGILLGFGWLSLFYGFKHSSVTTAVIIYNMCPIYVMIAAPIVLKEPSSKTQKIVIGVSFIGLLAVVGSSTEVSSALGMFLSGVSGLIYAIIVLINRSLKNRVNNSQGTFVQITMAMLVLLPFVIMEGDIGSIVSLNGTAVVMVLLLGVLHTGIAYSLFFSIYPHMKSIEIVSFSYLEPLFAICFSVILLNEKMTVLQIIGGVLILGSTYTSELVKMNKKKKFRKVS
jgi:drug/metabolite transporter (DMT)-like permease